MICSECKAFAFDADGRKCFCVIGGKISRKSCNRKEGRIDMDFNQVKKVNPHFSEWILPNYKEVGKEGGKDKERSDID